MKSKLQIPLVVPLVFLFVTNGISIAQQIQHKQRKAETQSSSKESERQLALLLPAKQPDMQDVFTSERYDRFRDVTIVSALPNDILGTEPTLRIYALFEYPGKTLCAIPKSVLLMFICTSKEWQYLKYHDLALIADGQRLGVVRTGHDGDIGKPYNGMLTERVWAYLPITMFLKIARAKKVEIRLGATEFQLDMVSLEGMTVLASRMRP
jgi:hypothetical protein